MNCPFRITVMRFDKNESYIRCNNVAVQQTNTQKAIKEIFILGITLDGKTFRPSDWADRLCGVMSPFRPGGPQPGSHLNYSPWCLPILINGVRCVVVNAELRDAEPMAWDFAINFAKDNGLQMSEACLLPG